MISCPTHKPVEKISSSRLITPAHVCCLPVQSYKNQPPNGPTPITDNLSHFFFILLDRPPMRYTFISPQTSPGITSPSDKSIGIRNK